MLCVSLTVRLVRGRRGAMARGGRGGAAHTLRLALRGRAARTVTGRRIPVQRNFM